MQSCPAQFAGKGYYSLDRYYNPERVFLLAIVSLAGLVEDCNYEGSTHRVDAG